MNECYIYSGLVYENGCYFNAPMWLYLHGFAEGESAEILNIPDIIPIVSNKFPDFEYYPGKIYEGAVEMIADWAFNGNKTLKEIHLPSSLKRIGKYVFANTRLQNVEIPSSVISIDEGAFLNSSIKSIMLPEGLEYLGPFCFSSCERLEKITLPSTLKSLNGYTFLYSGSIKEIVCYNPLPPNISVTDLGGITALYITPYECPAGPQLSKCIVYVPEESVDLYKNHQVWGRFRNIMPIESQITGVTDPEESTAPIDIDSNAGTAKCVAKKKCILQIFNLDGKTVKNKHLNAGESWEFRSNGIFILKVKDSNFEKKIIL